MSGEKKAVQKHSYYLLEHQDGVNRLGCKSEEGKAVNLVREAGTRKVWGCQKPKSVEATSPSSISATYLGVIDQEYLVEV